MFFSYDNVENKCDTNCTFHNKLIQTLPSLFFKPNYRIKYAHRTFK